MPAAWRGVMIPNTEFDRDVIIYAFRYTLGRHSYAPGLMRSKLDEIWGQLSQGDKWIIYRDIDEHSRLVSLSKPSPDSSSARMEREDLQAWTNWRDRKMRE